MLQYLLNPHGHNVNIWTVPILRDFHMQGIPKNLRIA